MAIRVFISHSERDVELVEPLKLWLELGLDLKNSEIRCTSVDNINAGGIAVEALRKDLLSAEAVVGLLTMNSLRSHWVQLEMGAGWLQDLLQPIRGPGVEMKDVPSPLSQFTMVSYCEKNAMQQLLQGLSGTLGTSVNNAADEKYESMVKIAQDKLALDMARWFSLPPVLSAWRIDPGQHTLGFRLLCSELGLQPDELFACATAKGVLTREPDHLPESARDLWKVSKSAVNFMLKRPTKHFEDFLDIPRGILNDQLMVDMKRALDSRWNHTSRVRNWFEEAIDWISSHPPSKHQVHGSSGSH